MKMSLNKPIMIRFLFILQNIMSNFIELTQSRIVTVPRGSGTEKHMNTKNGVISGMFEVKV